MPGLFWAVYLSVAVLQLAAIASWLAQDGAQGPITSAPLALVLTSIPFLGSALGTLGAMSAWSWKLYVAGPIFFWYVPVAVAVVAYRTYRQSPSGTDLTRMWSRRTSRLTPPDKHG